MARAGSRPPVAAAAAFMVSAVIGPVVLLAPRNIRAFFSAAVEIRLNYASIINKQWGPMSFTRFVEEAVPLRPLLPVFLAPVIACRKEKWFAPVAWWGAVLTLGTFFGMNRPVLRCLGPLEIGLYFPVSLSVLTVPRDWRAAQRRGGQ